MGDGGQDMSQKLYFDVRCFILMGYWGGKRLWKTKDSHELENISV